MKTIKARAAYWAWKLRPPYRQWIGQAWYWEGRWGRLSYWWPVHQAGPCAGQRRGLGVRVRLGRWMQGVLILPC